MEFYGMVGHNPGTNRLDFEPRSRSLKVKRPKSFLRITPGRR